nr:uncharacterized protein LOC109150247 [Ipomoea batatas]
MATWPSIGPRAAPIDSAAGAPATGTPTPSPRPIPSPATESIATEVTFDPQSQSNPYFLHPNENPALVLVSVPLDGPNYLPWARAMTMALSCKNKIKFVNGSITKPLEDDPKFDVWSRVFSGLSWIVRSLSPMVGQSVLWIDTAYGVWNDLKRRFSQQDLFRIAQIKCEIYQTKQGDSSLNEYFTHQKLLWDELQILRPTVADISADLSVDQLGQHHTTSPEQSQSPPLGEMFDHVPEQSQSPSLGEVPEHASPPEAPQQPVVRSTVQHYGRSPNRMQAAHAATKHHSSGLRAEPFWRRLGWANTPKFCPLPLSAAHLSNPYFHPVGF